MKLSLSNGITSLVLRVKIRDTASITGGGKTGLTSASSGLIISTIAENEATATAYTVAASNVETITTLGTFAAPTASKCRFKEVDSTNHPGLYEIHIANARWAVSNARMVQVTISGVSGAAQEDIEVQLNGATGTPLSVGTGTGQLSTSSGKAAATIATGDSVDATTILARIGSFTGTGVNTVLGFLKAVMSKAASTPSDVGGTFAASTDSTEAIRDNMSSSLGSGASSNTLIVQTTTLVPIADADVWITTDSAGTNVVAGTRQTNSSGEVTFMLDAGEVYYRWAQKDGVNFTNPQQFTAA